MLNCTIMSLIAATGGASLLLVYSGAMHFFAMNGVAGSQKLAIAVVLGLITQGLLRHKNELVDRNY
jgi:hypothetical protein